jgi:hypothetical protein
LSGNNWLVAALTGQVPSRPKVLDLAATKEWQLDQGDNTLAEASSINFSAIPLRTSRPQNILLALLSTTPQAVLANSIYCIFPQPAPSIKLTLDAGVGSSAYDKFAQTERILTFGPGTHISLLGNAMLPGPFDPPDAVFFHSCNLISPG